MICKKCKSENVVRSGRDKKGRQTYKCKDCNARFFSEVIEVKKKKLGVICIRCGSDNVSKNGKSGEGRQRYICRDCGLVSLMDKETTTIFSEDKIPEGLICPTCGGSDLVRSGRIIKTNSQKYKCKSCGRKFLKEYASEVTLTKEEKRIIIFYYFNFGVKIRDLAKYTKKPFCVISTYIKNYEKRMKGKENDGKVQVHACKRVNRIRSI